MATIDRRKLHQLHERETQRFISDHPQSAALYHCAQDSLLGGVPMNWMKKWAGPFPVFVQSAHGAHFTDVDNRLLLACAGGTSLSLLPERLCSNTASSGFLPSARKSESGRR
jgi:glutamate-1-semialdehyde 2,1-aminomutase